MNRIKTTGEVVEMTIDQMLNRSKGIGSFNNATLEASKRLAREIPLTRGMVALVDPQDYDRLMQWKWQAVKGRNTFYASRRLDISMAREILGLKKGDPQNNDRRRDHDLGGHQEKV